MTDYHNRMEWAGAVGWRGGHLDSGDLVDQLEAEHEKIRLLFAGMLGIPIGHPDRRGQLDEITAVIVRHGEIMERCVKPLLPRLQEGSDNSFVLTEQHSHGQTEAVLRRLLALKVDDPAFALEFAELGEHVTGHMSWEESRIFPLVRAGISEAELEQLGAKAREIRHQGRDTPSQSRTGS